MKMKKLLIICTLVLSLMIQGVVLAEPATASVPEVEIQSAQAYVGETSTVDIVLHHPQGLKTIEFQLNYDQAALELSDDSVARGDAMTEWLYAYKVNPDNGTVRVAAVHEAGFQNDQSAVIMRMTFKAKDAPGVKTYTITDLKGYTGADKLAEVTSATGTFDIRSRVTGHVPGIPTKQPTGQPDERIELKSELDSEGAANVQVDDKDVEEVVQHDDLAEVAVHVETPAEATSVHAGIGKQSIDRIVESGKKLIISSVLGDIELRHAVLAQWKGDAFTISIEREPEVNGKPVRTVAVTTDGEPIGSLGGSIKVRLPYETGADESGDNIVVYRLEGNRKILMPHARVANGAVEFVTQEVGAFAIGYNAKSFTDTARHWAKQSIDFVTARELFLGIGGDAFAPNDTMTRGMLVTVLGRLHGAIVSDTDTSFADVEAGKYYAPYIAWAYENGIVNGMGNGRFAPDKEVTREEMATMIASYIKHAELAMTDAGSEREFADEGSISSWALPAIKAMQENGILTGKPGNMFDPDGTATRAEVAKVMSKLIHLALQ
ncbi:S-layer homology domain-containing protein [Paenibacillus sp. J5C_2022]|uniref:S-layer homology domain-containing protein n=1 Tax=Paenibacillus sp. J5C2022 TaxID=2977129 RepID=UPI0021CDF54B|nr:S-layer homology domain-containing protein [Paenibacillus sp. J5C2022]MCU6710178.1 S-layer homology domain-containing protein [Paenibacillus sp. J5C2022]